MDLLFHQNKDKCLMVLYQLIKKDDDEIRYSFVKRIFHHSTFHLLDGDTNVELRKDFNQWCGCFWRRHFEKRYKSLDDFQKYINLYLCWWNTHNQKKGTSFIQLMRPESMVNYDTTWNYLLPELSQIGNTLGNIIADSDSPEIFEKIMNTFPDRYLSLIKAEDLIYRMLFYRRDFSSSSKIVSYFFDNGWFTIDLIMKQKFDKVDTSDFFWCTYFVHLEQFNQCNGKYLGVIAQKFDHKSIFLAIYGHTSTRTVEFVTHFFHIIDADDEKIAELFYSLGKFDFSLIHPFIHLFTDPQICSFFYKNLKDWSFQSLQLSNTRVINLIYTEKNRDHLYPLDELFLVDLFLWKELSQIGTLVRYYKSLWEYLKSVAHLNNDKQIELMYDRELHELIYFHGLPIVFTWNFWCTLPQFSKNIDSFDQMIRFYHDWHKNRNLSCNFCHIRSPLVSVGKETNQLILSQIDASIAKLLIE